MAQPHAADHVPWFLVRLCWDYLLTSSLVTAVDGCGYIGRWLQVLFLLCFHYDEVLIDIVMCNTVCRQYWMLLQEFNKDICWQYKNWNYQWRIAQDFSMSWKCNWSDVIGGYGFVVSNMYISLWSRFLVVFHLSFAISIRVAPDLIFFKSGWGRICNFKSGRGWIWPTTRLLLL